LSSGCKSAPQLGAGNPAERAAIMARSGRVTEERRDAVVDWLVKESGNSRTKAELEWQWAGFIGLQAAF